MATLTLIGFVCVAGLLLRPLLDAALFKTEIVRTLHAPDRKAVAEVEVRSGTTVWTTRVRLRDVRTGSRWTIYEKRNSVSVPQLRWSDRRTLIVELPCDKFDHASNPDDWQGLDPRDRLKVRLEYPAQCAHAG